MKIIRKKEAQIKHEAKYYTELPLFIRSSWPNAESIHTLNFMPDSNVT